LTDDHRRLLDCPIEDSRSPYSPSQSASPCAVRRRLVFRQKSRAHTNRRLSCGPIGSQLLVSLRRHLVLHPVRHGHENPASGGNSLLVSDLLFDAANILSPDSTNRDTRPAYPTKDGFEIRSQQVTGINHLIVANAAQRSDTRRPGDGCEQFFVILRAIHCRASFFCYILLTYKPPCLPLFTRFVVPAAGAATPLLSPFSTSTQLATYGANAIDFSVGARS
jgi:hypothetical protein